MPAPMKTNQFAEAPVTLPAPSRAVRKQVTVLFCDIADYTERATQVDPEILSEEIHEFQSICQSVAEEYEGHVSNYLGDGVMLLFGHPLASEFSPERAVRAALHMISAIKQNNKGPDWRNKKPLEIRIGIATGLVVVGERAGKQRDQEELIFGTAPNLAARLQAIAAPNTVVTALRTRRLVGLTFKFKDLGKHALKGFKQPINVWQILNQRKMQKRPGNALKRNSAPFISRKHELGLMAKAYESVCDGCSRFVHIVGEPGIGKTRLIRRFERTIATHDMHRMRVNCSSYYQNSFLKPVQDECFRWLRISETDDLESKQASVSWAMSVVNLSSKVDRHLLFSEFLDMPLPGPFENIELSPEERHQRIIHLLVQIILDIAKNQTLLLVVEDLHWADQSTLEALNALIARASEDRVLGIFTSRPPFPSALKADASLTNIFMHPLTQDESRQMVESFFTGTPVPQTLKKNLIHKSDGIPLFLEESCHSAIRHMGQASNQDLLLQNFTVPETLQDSLNARLDQLGESRAIAQLASTFGQSFSYPEVNRIAQANDIDADAGVDVLINENIVELTDNGIHDSFRFRHAMFQEAAYQSLLIKTRQHYHGQIADLLLSSDPDFEEQRPEYIAYHLSRTPDITRAIELWIKAGRQALESSAIADSMDHLQQGLGLVKKLENHTQQQKYELSLLLHFGVALTAGAGYYGFDVTRTYERAAELASEVGDESQEWTALYGLWRCLISQAEFGPATRMAVKLNQLSRVLDTPILKLTAIGIRAMSRMVNGKFNRSVPYYNHAVSLYNSEVDKNIGLKFGQHPFVTIQGLAAVNKLIAGDLPGSLEDNRRSLAVAREINHPYTIAETLKVAAMYEQLSLNMDRLRGHCLEAIEISDTYGFEGVNAIHRIFLAFADLITHRDADRIDDMKDNLLLYENKYGVLFLPYFQSLLAQGCLLMGRYEDAIGHSRCIIAQSERRGEKWMLAVLYCIMSEAAWRGELASREQIAEWYKSAVETAHAQGAILFMQRILNDRHSIALDPETALRYERLANPQIAASGENPAANSGLNAPSR